MAQGNSYGALRIEGDIMTKEEIIHRLNELSQERDAITSSYESAVKINKEKAASLVAKLNDIKIGDKINYSRYGENIQGVIVNINADYHYFNPPKYSQKPAIYVSYFKKNGTLRANSCRVYGDWSKAD